MPTIKDRSRLCAFTFADGRQCRTPRRSGHQHLCYYHAKKEAEALIAKQAGEDLASLFCGKVLCAPDFAARPRTRPFRRRWRLHQTENRSLPCSSRSRLEPIHQDRPRRIRQCSWRKCPARAGGLRSPTSCPTRAPFPSCSNAAVGALRYTRTQPSITTATRSAPSTKSFRINTCAERLIITPVTIFRINTFGSVDSKAT